MEHNWSHFNQKGWCFLDSNAEHHQWIESAKASIVKKFDQRKYKKSDFRSGATWFTGINFLDNGPNGDIMVNLSAQKFGLRFLKNLVLKSNIGMQLKCPFVGKVIPLRIR